jgi:hypothetical protein
MENKPDDKQILSTIEIKILSIPLQRGLSMIDKKGKQKVLAVFMAIEKVLATLTPEEKSFLDNVCNVAKSRGNKAAEALFRDIK